MKRPPIEHWLDEQADIIQTDSGWAVETPLVTVQLSETLVGRLLIQSMSARRRTTA